MPVTDVESSPITFEYLRKFNIAMGVLHLVQGLLMLALGFFVDELSDFSRDLYTFYLKFEGNAQTGFDIAPNPEISFIFQNVGPLIASFLLLSAIAHLLIAYPLNNNYNNNLRKNINVVRWFEYAFSSSIMLVFIAILFGVWDIWMLFLMFVLNALMNMFGLMMELHNQHTEKTNWTAYILGWVAGAAPWIVILAYFASTTVVGGEIPTFVYAIFVVEFIFFNTFAINMFLQYKKVGPWKDYLYGERWYQILSLFAKTALAWLVFAGLLQPA